MPPAYLGLATSAAVAIIQVEVFCKILHQRVPHQQAVICVREVLQKQLDDLVVCVQFCQPSAG